MDESNNNGGEVVLSPVEIQQEYYENLPDCDWVKYDYSNRRYLLQNIAFALFGSPTTEGDLSHLINAENSQLEGYTSRQIERVKKIYDKICEQSKYAQNDRDILLSILLVVCAQPRPVKFYKIEPRDHWVDLHQRNDVNIWCTAVFCIRTCIPTTIGAKPCKIFIDEDARVYQNWASYLTDNTLPKCVIIAPENGEYQGVIVEGEEIIAVKLTVTPSPSLGLKSRVLSSVDTASTVASIGVIGILGAAALTPVAPAVLITATAATVATGIYGLVRSSLHLHDRSVHEQTISLKDAEARGSWLNIAASGVGLAAGAASGLLSKSAAAGNNLSKTGQALATSVEILRHANLVTGGAGILNSLMHIIQKYRKHGEKPTTLELFQFSSASLFFFHAVVSNRTAQNIIEDAQANTINEYRSNLRSNRHRKIFDKINAETRRVQGTIQGNTEVIKGIQNIANKDQYFADVLKINKELNQHKLRISMTADGRVNLNAAHKFNPSELYGMGSEGRAQLFSALGPADLSAANAPTRVAPSTTAVASSAERDEDSGLLVGIHPGEIIRIGTLLMRVSASGAENISLLLENLSQDLYANLMTVSFNVLSKLVPEEIAKLRLLNPEEDLIVQIVKFVFRYLKDRRPMGDCRNTDNGIVIVLKEFFQEGRVRQETILELKHLFVNWVQEQIHQRSQEFPNKKRITCPKCDGVRFA